MSIYHTECSVFTHMCGTIRTPIAELAAKMVSEGNWLGLVSIKVEPSSYQNSSDYFKDVQVAAFFKKFKGFDLGIDLKAKALDTFWESERQCYQSNERLSPLLSDENHYGERLGSFIRTWRKKVKRVLGKAPKKYQLAGRFGPGSTFSDVGDFILIPDKLSDNITCTEHSAEFQHFWDVTAWARFASRGLQTGLTAMFGDAEYQPDERCYAERSFEVVRGNRFTTVDKDALRKRGICIEPSLNVFYQLAVGQWLTDRMRRVLGWDKSTAADFHRRLARIGSLTGAVATIDLSNASDTVCRLLVQLLLPDDWFSLLNGLRSSHTFIGGHWARLEKFSSMGNGFTFELETLIFWTLVQTVESLEPATEDAFTPGLTTSVFGDDIICPRSVSKSAVAALKFFGFTPNESKTFLDGPFRESCGGDYFAGDCVRPFHLKEPIHEPAQLISLANRIRNFGDLSDRLGCGIDWLTTWFRVLDRIPRQIRRCRGPKALGDLVIWDEQHTWDISVRDCIRYLRVWRPVPNRMKRWDSWRPGVQLAAALYGVPSGAPSILGSDDNRLVDIHDRLRRTGVIPRINGEYVSGYRFGRVAYS